MAVCQRFFYYWRSERDSHNFYPTEMELITRLIHNMSFLSACDSPVQVIEKIVLLVHIGDLHVGVLLCVEDNLSMSILVRPSIIDRFFKSIIQMESDIVSIQAYLVGLFQSTHHVWIHWLHVG